MLNKMKEKLGTIIEDTCNLLKVYLLKAKEELYKMSTKEEE